MNQTDPKIDLSSRINDQIKNDHVKIRSKWFFIVEKLGLEGSIILLVLLSILFSSFVIYVMQRNGVFEFLEFGIKGWLVVLQNIPYELVLIALTFIIISFIVIKQFDFSYRKPFYYISGFVLFIIAAAGVSLFWTGVSDALFDKVTNTSTVKNLYGNKLTNSPKESSAVLGKVIRTGGSVVLVKTPQGKTVQIRFTPAIETPMDKRFQIGDTIKVLGKKAGNEFTAEIIRTLNNQTKYFNETVRATDEN